MVFSRNFRLSRKKQLFSAVLITCLITILFLTISIPVPGVVMNLYYWVKPDKGVSCHYIKTDRANSLKDISDTYPKEGRSIFFHETSCNSFRNGKITITARQACAVESAARMNPDYDVYLLYASPGTYKMEDTESDRFLMELLKYRNVRIYHIDMDRYFMNTPVESLWKQQQMKQSRFAQSHTSDVLRFLTLWKYGGIYLDLDVIVTKSLDDLGTDFTGFESKTSVAAGILSFNYTGDGHDFANSCLEDLKNNFKGHDWGWNGPGTVTRLIKRLCEENNIPKLVNKTCKGFKIYPPNRFYSIPWWNWKYFFQEEFLDFVKKQTADSYLIHVWNKFSTDTNISLHYENVPYLNFAKLYCPAVVAQCDRYF
ncbi:lactosylceramide 4-alpha-galactosyltransferase isoform X2 [Dendroctonus ponderosae]